MDLGASEEELAFDEGGGGEDYTLTGIALSDYLEEEASSSEPPPSAFCLKVPEKLSKRLASLTLTDPLTSRRTDLPALLRPFRSLIVLCLPAYLPSAAMRHMMGGLEKIKVGQAR